MRWEYSKKLERERILETFKKRGWYEKNGYQYYLPALDSYQPQPIRSWLQKNYFRDSYRDLANECKAIFNKIPGIEYFDISQTKILLTKYGTGGGYYPKHKILVNIRNKEPAKIVKIIIHELIHLKIEPLIKKYKLSHWEKERLVDLLAQKKFPQHSMIQNIPMDTKKIDHLFSIYYPDLEKIGIGLRRSDPTGR